MMVARRVALGPAHSAPPALRAPWAFGTGQSVREVLLLHLQRPPKPQAGVVCIAGVPYTPPSQHVPARQRPHLWTRPLRPRPLRPGAAPAPEASLTRRCPGPSTPQPTGAAAGRCSEPPGRRGQRVGVAGAEGSEWAWSAAEGRGWAWPAVTRFILSQPTMEVGKSRHGWVEGLAGCTGSLCWSWALSVRLPVLSSAMWPQCEGHDACSQDSPVAGWGSPFVDVVLPGRRQV